jgi:hypothetical protein
MRKLQLTTTSCHSTRRVFHVSVGCKLFPTPADPYNASRSLPLRFNGYASHVVSFHDNPSTPHEAILSIVGTDKRRGWVGNSDRGFDLNDIKYGSFSQYPPYKKIPVVADLRSARPNRVTPLAAAVLRAAGVELHRRGWICSTLGALTSSERLPMVLLPVCLPRAPTHASHR